MTINVFNDTEEHLAHVRAQILTDLSAALRALDQAAARIEALRSVDTEFVHGRDGRDVAAHLDDRDRVIITGPINSTRHTVGGVLPAGQVGHTASHRRSPHPG